MKILLVEPFYTSSHAAWADGLKANSSHEIELLTLPGRHWKWRMHGGAISLAEEFLKSAMVPDLILASDMLDLNIFLSLTREQTQGIPTAIYFHENQLTYPWSPEDEDVQLQRDNHYSFINYASALAADRLFFNSEYHLNSFLEALPEFLKAFPDHQGTDNIQKLKTKSQKLHLGMDLQAFDQHQIEKQKEPPLVVWNHRWEYDKNADDFFRALFTLQDKGIDFHLAVLGESYEKAPVIFQEAKEKLKDKIVAFGFCKNFEEYASWLWKADILPVTSYQDFFGGSVVQAMYCGAHPLLPQRLAYPEHIAKELQADHFYTNQEDLVQRLEMLLEQKNFQNLNEQVQRYDWKNCIQDYDATLASVVQKS